MPHTCRAPHSDQKERFRNLMEQIQLAHYQFEDTFSKVQQTEIGKYPHDWEKRLQNINRLANTIASPFYIRRNRSIKALIQELQLPMFLEGHVDAINRVIDFCEVNVRAFGCGSRKEWCLHRLKRLPLTEPQIQRLQHLALAHLTRRERGLRAYARLMIRLADRPFIEQVREIAAQEDDALAQKKARLMLKVIGNSRSDLV